MNVDILISGAVVITMDEGRRILRDGAVAFTGDRIVAVGPREEVDATCRAEQAIDGRGFLVTPGFVNGHVHLTETLIRGFLPEDLPFDEELSRWVIPLYKSMTPQEESVASLLAIAAMLRSGTTTFLEAGTINAFDEVMAAIAGSGIRGRTGRWAEDRDWSGAGDQAAMTRGVLTALQADLAKFPQDGRALAAWPNLIGHSTGTDALWQGAAALATQTGTGISAHMSPVDGDPQWFLAHTGRRPVTHLAALGVLGPWLNLVHMVYVNETEIGLLAETNTNVTHCPGAAIRCGFGAGLYGQFPEMAAAGVNLSLGTDGADNHDLMRVMTLMAALYKDARVNRSLFPAHQVLEMATVNGARTAGMAGEIGALAPGMKADLVLHDIRRPEWQPLNDPVRQLVWSADGRGVDSVWVDGQRVVEKGRCLLIDEEDLYRAAQAAAESIISRSGLPWLRAWAVT